MVVAHSSRIHTSLKDLIKDPIRGSVEFEEIDHFGDPMSNPLFKDTVTVTDVRGPRGNEIFSFVSGCEAIRVLHRDKPIKVLITEEFYLNLLTFWQSHSTEPAANQSREDMKKAARSELSAIVKKDSQKRSVG